MILPPPRSPLFPYTTLFRSTSSWPERPHRPRSTVDSGSVAHLEDLDRHATAPTFGHCSRISPPGRPTPQCRSEEHTSELQSLRHLVCRLLLEKKKIDRKHHA